VAEGRGRARQRREDPESAVFGLNTTANAANPLSARINKALFTALYAADGGDGSVLYTMKKEIAGDDVGVLLHTNYILHAMLGLMGGADFYLRCRRTARRSSTRSRS
jgi:hypothetical protein